MSHIQVKANQLRTEAERKLRSGTFLENLFAKNWDKILESVKYYTRAGNLFKTTKNYAQAGQAFADAADLCYENKNAIIEAVLNYAEAAHCFSQTDINLSINYYVKCANILENISKFEMSAKYLQIVASLLEGIHEYDEAMQYFEKAAKYYRKDCSFNHANECIEKVGDYAALAGDYDKAIVCYEKIACFDLASSLLKYSAKEALYRAAVCFLCSNVCVSVIKKRLKKYVKMFPSFEDSKEYQFLICITRCVQYKDVEEFLKTRKKYEEIAPLSEWDRAMLTKIENRIEK